MRELAHDDYLELRQDAEVVERDGFGDKVLLLPDGTYLKLFRRKRLLSSALFYPYARRFADNVGALARRGIACPDMIGLYRIGSIARDAVHYRPLAGRTLRHIVKAGTDAAEAEKLRCTLGTFVARLHGLGVYFRSLHLGNIVLTPEGTLGLIDVADLSARSGALGTLRRTRNMKHLLRYPGENEWITAGGGFLAAYKAASKRTVTGLSVAR